MNIVDALMVFLRLDTKNFHDNAKQSEGDLKKLRDEAKKVVDEFNKVGDSVETMAIGLATRAMSLFAMFSGGRALGGFIESTIQSRAALYEFSSSLNINIEDIQAWGRAVKNEGGSAESFQGAIQSMTMGLSLLGTNTRRAKRMEMFLGIAGLTKEAVKGKDAFQVLVMLAEKMQKMAPAKALMIGSMMGLDIGTTRLLMKGREEALKLVEAQRAMGVFTLEAAKAADDLDDSWNDAQNRLKKVAGIALEYLFPAIELVVDKLNDFGEWAKANPAIIKAGFLGIASAVTVLSAAVTYFATVSAIMMLNPIAIKLMLIAAAIGLVVSGIAYLSVRFQEWQKGGMKVTNTLERIFAAAYQVASAIKPLFDFASNEALSYLVSLMEGWAGFFELVVGFFTSDAKKMEEGWERFTKHVLDATKILIFSVEYAFASLLRALFNSWKAAWDAMADYPVDRITYVMRKINRAVIPGAIIGESIGNLILRKMGLEDPYEARMRFISGGAVSAASGGGASRQNVLSVQIDNININAGKPTADSIASSLTKKIDSEIADWWRGGSPRIAQADSGLN